MAHEKTTHPKPEAPVEISSDMLSEQAMAGIIENFILREGTDYGREEVSYDRKAEQIRRQIEHGDIKIVFDQSSETVSLLTNADFKRLFRQLASSATSAE